MTVVRWFKLKKIVQTLIIWENATPHLRGFRRLHKCPTSKLISDLRVCDSPAVWCSYNLSLNLRWKVLRCDVRHICSFFTLDSPKCKKISAHRKNQCLSVYLFICIKLFTTSCIPNSQINMLWMYARQRCVKFWTVWGTVNDKGSRNGPLGLMLLKYIDMKGIMVAF